MARKEFTKEVNEEMYDALYDIIKEKLNKEFKVDYESYYNMTEITLFVNFEYKDKGLRKKMLEILKDELSSEGYKNINEVEKNQTRDLSSSVPTIYFKSKNDNITYFITVKPNGSATDMTRFYEGLQVAGFHLTDPSPKIKTIKNYLNKSIEYDEIIPILEELYDKQKIQNLDGIKSVKQQIEMLIKHKDDKQAEIIIDDSLKIIMSSLIFNEDIISQIKTDNLNIYTIHDSINKYYLSTQNKHPFGLENIKQDFDLEKNNTQDQVLFLSETPENFIDILKDDNSIVIYYLSDYEMKGFDDNQRKVIKEYISRYNLNSLPEGTICLLNNNNLYYFYQISLKKGKSSAQKGKSTQQIKAMTGFNYEDELLKISEGDKKINDSQFDLVGQNISLNTWCINIANNLLSDNESKIKEQLNIVKSTIESTNRNINDFSNFIYNNGKNEVNGSYRLLDPNNVIQKIDQLLKDNKISDNDIYDFIYKTVNNYQGTGQLLKIIDDVTDNRKDINYVKFDKFFTTVSYSTIFGNTILPLYKLYGYENGTPYEYLGNYFSFFEYEGDIINIIEYVDEKIGVFNIKLTIQKDLYYTLTMEAVDEIIKKEAEIKKEDEIDLDDELIIQITQFQIRTNSNKNFTFVIESPKSTHKDFKDLT